MAAVPNHGVYRPIVRRCVRSGSDERVLHFDPTMPVTQKRLCVAVCSVLPTCQLRGAALLAVAVLALCGCALVFRSPPADQPPVALDLQACSEWYAALDQQIESAGVRDSAATRIGGFAYLRSDRFSAALGGVLTAPVADVGNEAKARRQALVRHLTNLDLQARWHEISNLPQAVRVGLASGLGNTGEVAHVWQHAQACALRLGASDAESPQQMARLQARLVVPDDYATGYRMLGLYALTHIPFVIGVQAFEAQREAAFLRDRPPPPGTQRVRLSPPARPPVGSMTSARLRKMLTPAAEDPLGLPAPDAEALDHLYAQFAPIFELDIGNDDDRPGALAWRECSRQSTCATPVVDTAMPVVYRQYAHTRYQGRNLLQLVYTIWFGHRRAARSDALDWLSGRLDGVVFRVTLAPDGTPLVYDSMHPCGCYHMFFPTPAARPRPAAQSHIEWAFSPQRLPAIGVQNRVVVRVAAGTHYVERLGVEREDAPGQYAWRDYDSLRSLPTPGGATRSVFGADGFIAGTDRAEAWLFWPMGVRRAGAMRQWGRHATAFVGRRHFDDADLFERRFELDLGRE